MASRISDPEGYHNFDTRNVADKYKGMPEEEIRADLRATSSPFQAWFFNLTSDFNKSVGLRTANAFNAEQVVFIGSKKWDRRGAVGTHHYTPMQFVEASDFARMVGEAKALGHQIIGVDNVEGAYPLHKISYHKPGVDIFGDPNPRTIFVFGEEQLGLSAETLALCDEVVYIPQVGTVRSLNVGTASGIIFYDFMNKIGLL